jgi:hypothetical protein
MARRLTNWTLVSFIDNLPLRDRRQALFATCQFDRRDQPVPTFFANLSPHINWSLITPADFLLRASLLFDGTPVIKRFAFGVLDILGDLMMNPDMVNPPTTIESICESFTHHLYSEHATQQWFSLLVPHLERAPALMPLLRFGMASVSKRLKGEPIRNVHLSMNILQNLVSLPRVVLAMEEPRWLEMLDRVFSKSFYPTAAPAEFREYFGRFSMERARREEELLVLDRIIGDYHGLLANLMVQILNGEGKERLLNWIRDHLNVLKWDQNEAKDLTAELWALEYNLEGALIRVTHILRNRAVIPWKELDPLAPHRPRSIAPSGPPLAVAGVNPWVVPGRERAVREANPEPSEGPEAAAAWSGLLAGAREPPDDVNQIFFATVSLMSSVSIYYAELVTQLSRRQTNPDLQVFVTISLTLPQRAKLVRELLFGVLEFLLHVGGFREADHAFATEEPPVAFQHLPDYMASVPCALFAFLFTYGIIRQPPDLEMRMLAHLFSSHRYLKSPVHRFGVVRFYALVSAIKEHAHLIVVPTLLREAYPEVIQFYGSAACTGLLNEEGQAVKIREYCLYLISRWLQFPEPSVYFSEHLNHPYITKFLSFFLPDAEKSVADLVRAMQYFGDDRAKVKDRIEDVDSYIRLLERIARIAPQALAMPGLETVVPKMVIYAFDRFVRVDALRDISGRWRECGYTPVGFLVPVVIVAMSISSSPKQVARFADPSLGYRDGLYEEIARLLARFAFDNDTDVKGGFAMFIDRVNRARAPPAVSMEPGQPGNLGIPRGEIPPEFTDLVTGDLMRDPVLLPGPETKPRTCVDRSTLAEIDFIDPLTGEAFNIEDVEENTNLKRRIQKWVWEWKRNHAK